MKDEQPPPARLSWAQITWGVAILVALLSAWFDMRSTQQAMLARLEKLERLAESGVYTKTEVDLMLKDAVEELDRTDRRLDRIEEWRRTGR